MSILSYSRLANLLKNKTKSDGVDVFLPQSALEKVNRTSDSKPFNINRDANGTRPWHSYSSKQSASK